MNKHLPIEINWNGKGNYVFTEASRYGAATVRREPHTSGSIFCTSVNQIISEFRLRGRRLDVTYWTA